ncbi:HAD family hydrolase [Neisseria wadsworthii]|uniref:HAD family hydrolase n=1 Tax=Neisseria wadsworthii TaxID=607711 RepID=UPI000D304BED|nr:HAD family hydrolase [Neisseria wadsworthii]
MTIQAVLFDLDGTLADTALDLGGALNSLLRKHGLPEKPMEEIRPVASHGASGLIMLGAGISTFHPHHDRWRKNYLAEYEQCFDKDTVLFDGINELIGKLVDRGLKWGIITNKPQTFTDRLVPKLAFAEEPAVVVSGDTCEEPKPSVKPMRHACAELGIPPEACLYVGDAERDMIAARKAGMTSVLAEWGYISQDDTVEDWPVDFSIEKPLDLLKHL